jgi:hypothetical protein
MRSGRALARSITVWRCSDRSWAERLRGPRSALCVGCRQWLVRKLTNCIAHFGVSGCMECEHRIAWCEVGEGITEIVRTLQ